MDKSPENLESLDLARRLEMLMDLEDEAFLRKKLPRAEFFRLKRLRIRTTWKYVSRIADRSGAALQAHAALARYRLDVNQAKAVSEVGDRAWEISVQCMVAFAKLSVEYLLPAIHFRFLTRKPVNR